MIIETQIELVNTKMEEILGSSEVIRVNMTFDLNDVSAIREIAEDDCTDIQEDRCHIYMKSGEHFMIFTPYKTILEHFKHKL